MKKAKPIRLILKLMRAVAILIVFLLFVSSLFYLPTTIYNFPKASPFSGEFIYNPYDNLPERVFRANFHAHTIEWKGITDGHNSEAVVFQGYIDHGYEVAGISNYHKISTYGKEREGVFIPMYEHGYNILKSHYLSINPDGVSFFDFPLFQTTSHQQMVINKLRKRNAYVAMAHPKFGGARTRDGMRNLTSYHFTEVLNHYRNSSKYWDEALSAGRLTWVMGNDDTHDLIREPTFRRWNMIFANDANADSILHAYSLGKNYAVLSKDMSFDKKFTACNAIGDQNFICSFNAHFDSIFVIGQNGKTKEVIIDTNQIAFGFDETDTYLRVLAKDENMQILLNPLVRYDGIQIPLNANLKAETNHLFTWMFRIGLFFVAALFVLMIRKLIIIQIK